jgi:hypothetical protein
MIGEFFNAGPIKPLQPIFCKCLRKQVADMCLTHRSHAITDIADDTTYLESIQQAVDLVLEGYGRTTLGQHTAW